MYNYQSACDLTVAVVDTDRKGKVDSKSFNADVVLRIGKDHANVNNAAQKLDWCTLVLRDPKKLTLDSTLSQSGEYFSCNLNDVQHNKHIVMQLTFWIARVDKNFSAATAYKKQATVSLTKLRDQKASMVDGVTMFNIRREPMYEAALQMCDCIDVPIITCEALLDQELMEVHTYDRGARSVLFKFHPTKYRWPGSAEWNSVCPSYEHC